MSEDAHDPVSDSIRKIVLEAMDNEEYMIVRQLGGWFEDITTIRLTQMGDWCAHMLCD